MIRFFVRHPVAANLLMVAICILGIGMISSIERETFPEFTASTVGVSAIYPGASARDVDENVCAPIEDALIGVEGLEDLTCLSVAGRANATAELVEGGDLTQFFNDIFSAVSGITTFPSDVETPAVEVLARSDVVAMIAVSGLPTRAALADYTDGLADRILALPGVSRASVSGITDREFQVAFDEATLRQHGLSSSDITGALTSRSLSRPLGDAELKAGSITLRYADVRRSVAELEDLIVLQTSAGAVVRLGDIASVTLSDKNPDISSYINGVQAAIITFSKSKEDDSIRVYNAVEKLLEAERATYPDTLSLSVIANNTTELNERLALIVKNIAMGLVLVFATMWLFFSIREALWISAALPVSFLGSLFIMSVFGITINMITLVALLMAVGLIMDDSIVIAENIDNWRRKGASATEAAWRGTVEVMPGVVSSFLTTVAVFGPLMFMTGRLGVILKFIPTVLLITLALSLIEGFLILPHHLSHAGGDGPEGHENRRAAQMLERFKEGVVLPVAGWLAKWRYATLGSVIALLMLALSLVVSGTIKVIPFPSSESDTVIARVALTDGIARDRTIQTVEQLVAGLTRVNADLSPNTQGQVPLVDRVLVEYGTNSEVKNNGSNTATVTVDLLPSSQRNVAADDVVEAWRRATGPMPDLVQSSFAQSVRGPAGADLDVELRGHDLHQLETAASELLARLLEREDVIEAHQDLYGGQQELQFALTTYGYAVGLTPKMLSDQLRAAFEGAETDSFRVNQSNLTVRAQLSETVQTLSELEQFPIRLAGGEQVALSSVAEMKMTRGYPVISRKNGMAMARLTGQIDGSKVTSAQISKVVTDELGPALVAKYPGIEIGIGGATEEQNKSQSSLGKLMGLGLIGVYMILAFQFRSYALPLVIMAAIPFALVGSILAHWALGLAIAMPSMIGFASLSGIVVNNSILFLTFFQTHLEKGDYEKAALNAARARFRPILLSTLTTFAGLVPIIFDSSPQVQILVPLVVSVAFGLLASMVMVVLVFPSLLSIYFDWASLARWTRAFDKGSVDEALGVAGEKPAG
ncbi:Efflux pump membrane transporter BepE [Aliiroseovarius sp. xm-m-379]|uniref:efflux RND transporter permease subunit n=1 Tax=unclassified Aliiroseovarius TaxID=2623558 RepID=UPI001568C706|nr:MULTISPECIES: efflux RND transporter permease subunit [unclassified Aliiroseovarius]NRP13922.1 Efflux pump membrane transporter BepE [Aliiroseovarius sp. xm-d-517]NRP25433.1 Efflux pump membrane transporter BepE [Aliiroseovarius sp. xm-m-379]NRP29425.1 Efflux pump membrane transporter BepE [Aliiroseovarius sp. xm-m-314]NRP34232.1 Efflux pump membrane transporter BepE [Aliiroseovarius sp. xm-a-104]NRP41809.1 Efflux pump membrane transporter BepE [Aliiroseovarius sp. xm-m-339-2]